MPRLQGEVLCCQETGLCTMRVCRMGGCRVMLALVLVITVILLCLHGNHFLDRGLQKDMQPRIGKHVAVWSITRQSEPEKSLPDDHADLKFLRKYGRISGLPTEQELQNMTKKELTYIYHSHLDNTDYACHRKIRMGTAADGGWDVCDDYEFRPIKPCVVYSFGINFDFSFDDDMGKLYGCNVFSFDPTMKMADHERSPKVRFFKVGLGGAGGALSADIDTRKVLATGGSIKSMTDIKTMLGHTNTTIDIMKIDIEYSEWSALPDMLDKGELTNVRQLLMEFHTYAIDTDAIYRKRLLIFAKLEALGYRRYHTHTNPWGYKLLMEYPVMRTTAYEVYFVNTKFMRQ
ncbi:probable methyltransferase-like protein 24 isoform X2 [Littorina saxatilis]|uniref:Methyltransferase domain-containing protein n=1 Tax=Littorina saxatilis TaxID=31220 RepID=A0AAN9BJT0_9CAEN